MMPTSLRPGSQPHAAKAARNPGRSARIENGTHRYAVALWLRCENPHQQMALGPILAEAAPQSAHL
jgi:hypothetical protein